MIKTRDTDLNIDSYIKLSSITINEVGTFLEESKNKKGEIELIDTGIKKYNIVCNLDFYTNEDKEFIYKKTQVSIDGLKEDELSLVNFYTKLMEKIGGEKI